MCLPTKACIDTLLLWFSVSLVVTVVFRASHSAAAVENGSVSVIFAIVEQLRSKPSIYQAVTLLFKQKASFYLFLSVLVHISRLWLPWLHIWHTLAKESTGHSLACCSLDPEVPTILPLSAFHISLYLFFHVYLSCACMCRGVLWCTCGDQRTVCSNWFFPFTTWGPIKLRSFRLTGEHLYQLSLVYLLTLLYPGSLIILCRNNREMYKYIL